MERKHKIKIATKTPRTPRKEKASFWFKTLKSAFDPDPLGELGVLVAVFKIFVFLSALSFSATLR